MCVGWLSAGRWGWGCRCCSQAECRGSHPASQPARAAPETPPVKRAGVLVRVPGTERLLLPLLLEVLPVKRAGVLARVLGTELLLLPLLLKVLPLLISSLD